MKEPEKWQKKKSPDCSLKCLGLNSIEIGSIKWVQVSRKFLWKMPWSRFAGFILNIEVLNCILRKMAQFRKAMHSIWNVELFNKTSLKWHFMWAPNTGALKAIWKRWKRKDFTKCVLNHLIIKYTHNNTVGDCAGADAVAVSNTLEKWPKKFRGEFSCFLEKRSIGWSIKGLKTQHERKKLFVMS